MKKSTIKKLKAINVPLGELSEKRQRQLKSINNGSNIEYYNSDTIGWVTVNPSWNKYAIFRLSPSYKRPKKDIRIIQDDMLKVIQEKENTMKQETIEKLKEIDEMYQRCKHADWDGEDALPIKKSSINHIKHFIELLDAENLPLPEPAPSNGGYMGLEWYREGKSLVIEIPYNEKLEFSFLSKEISLSG